VVGIHPYMRCRLLSAPSLDDTQGRRLTRMTTISDSRSLEYLETNLPSVQTGVCHRRHTEHSSSSEIACLNLAINLSFFSSGMLSTATAGSSVTIPFGSKVAGFRISSTKLWGTRLEDKHNWRTTVSHSLYR